jgi:hypothetical protein
MTKIAMAIIKSKDRMPSTDIPLYKVGVVIPKVTDGWGDFRILINGTTYGVFLEELHFLELNTVTEVLYT